jgi:hypothetical protein
MVFQKKLDMIKAQGSGLRTQDKEEGDIVIMHDCKTARPQDLKTFK